MGQQHEHEQHPSGDRRDREKIQRHWRSARFSSATARYPQQISASDRSTTTSAASMRYPAAQPTTESTCLVGDLILANHRSAARERTNDRSERKTETTMGITDRRLLDREENLNDPGRTAFLVGTGLLPDVPPP
jgi:hypothetical protein